MNQILTEQPAQEVDYYYDTNPLNGSYSAQAWGRLAAVTFAAGYSYQYSYNQAGRVTEQGCARRTTGASSRWNSWRSTGGTMRAG